MDERWGIVDDGTGVFRIAEAVATVSGIIKYSIRATANCWKDAEYLVRLLNKVSL